MKTSPSSDCAFNDSAFRQVGEASYAFEIVRGDALTDGLCRELATVFSTSYGRWSADVPPPRKFYHKEQFPESSSGLRAEYLVVDRRYTLPEITGLLDACGLEVAASRYVRAGFREEYTNSTGKEILLVAKPRLPQSGQKSGFE